MLLSAPADSTRGTGADTLVVIGRRNPTGALLRSAVLPGWGQLYNEEPIKGIVFAAVELGLLGWLIAENGAAEDARLSGDDPSYQIHRQRRLDLIWYTSAAWLLGMMDAYVDAHLYSFTAENREFERETGIGVSLRVRF